MSTTQQPEALVFANDRPSAIDDDLYQWAIDAEDLIRSQHARILELEAARIAYASEFEPDADGDPDVGNIHANIRALKAQLFAIGAGGVEPLRKRVAAPQAVQAAAPDNWRDQFSEAVYEDLSAADNQDVPLEEYPARILNVLDAIVGPRHPTVIKWRNDAIRSCIAIAYKYCRDPESHRYLKQDLEAMLAAPAHPTEGATAQIETLRAELADETEAADNWRRLALQFDNHRMQALGHLKAILHPDSSVDEYKAAELFLKAPPLDGEAVLAQRIAALAAQAKQGECGMTTKKTIAAINAEIPRLEQEMQSPADTHDLMDAVLNCPHSITHESVTLHFYPKQKEGHNALSQLRHRLADYDLAARQREMQLLSEIEALERLALANLKQREEGA